MYQHIVNTEGEVLLRDEMGMHAKYGQMARQHFNQDQNKTKQSRLSTLNTKYFIYLQPRMKDFTQHTVL